jgi:hypothetical protein
LKRGIRWCQDDRLGCNIEKMVIHFSKKLPK